MQTITIDPETIYDETNEFFKRADSYLMGWNDNGWGYAPVFGCTTDEELIDLASKYSREVSEQAIEDGVTYEGILSCLYSTRNLYKSLD